MRARAHVRTEVDVDGERTRLAVLRSQAPLSLRPIVSAACSVPAHVLPVHVCLTAAAAGPVGGDELRLDIEIGRDSALSLSESSASLVLPGRSGAWSHTTVRVAVAAGATLAWTPEPMIAAAGCRHINDVVVDLDPDARLLMREQLILGRRGERSGTLRQRVRVRRGGRPLYAQDLDLGPGNTSPATVGSNRAVGSLLVVDPHLVRREARMLSHDGVLLPLADTAAVLVSSLAPDNTGLRRQFDEALAALGPPWGPAGAGPITDREGIPQ